MALPAGIALQVRQLGMPLPDSIALQVRDMNTYLQGAEQPHWSQPSCMKCLLPQGHTHSPRQLTTRTSDSSCCRGQAGKHVFVITPQQTHSRAQEKGSSHTVVSCKVSLESVP